MPNDKKLSFEEAMDQQRLLDDGNVVSFNGPPGYEGAARPNIEDFLNRGTHKSEIPISDEPLAFYEDVTFMEKHFNKIFAKTFKGVRASVIWEHSDEYIYDFAHEGISRPFPIFRGQN